MIQLVTIEEHLEYNLYLKAKKHNDLKLLIMFNNVICFSCIIIIAIKNLIEIPIITKVIQENIKPFSQLWI